MNKSCIINSIYNYASYNEFVSSARRDKDERRIKTSVKIFKLKKLKERECLRGTKQRRKHSRKLIESEERGKEDTKKKSENDIYIFFKGQRQIHKEIKRDIEQRRSWRNRRGEERERDQE